MAAKKTKNSTEREHRLRKVAELYLTRFRQVEVAKKLGISQQQVSYDLRTLRSRWREDATRAIGVHKAEELARIDHLEREAWKEWDRSRKREKHLGDPRYLNVVHTCIKKRCDMMGLEDRLEQKDVIVPLIPVW